MREIAFSIAINALVSLTSAAATSTCAADNCYRAVLGTVNSMSSTNVVQCSKILACTSTPAVVTSLLSFTSTPITTVTVSETPSIVTVTITEIPSETVINTLTITPTPFTEFTTTTATSTVSVTVYGSANLGKRGVLQERDSGTLSCPTTAVIPAYASFCSGFSRYSSACSCAGVTRSTVILTASTTTISTTTTTSTATVLSTSTFATPTVTVTQTRASSTVDSTITLPPTTTTSVVQADEIKTSTTTISSRLPALCGNAGLRYAFYRDGQAAITPADDTAFDPTIIKQKIPGADGSTPRVYYNFTSSYDRDFAGAPLFILNHIGYLFIPETGPYTFTANAIDDIVYLWLGKTAYSGWDKTNWAQFVTYKFGPQGNNLGPGSGSVTVSLDSGTYVPIRLLLKNGLGEATLNYSITSPSGKIILDGSTSPSPYVVQASCDGTTAPIFR